MDTTRTRAKRTAPGNALLAIERATETRRRAQRRVLHVRLAELGRADAAARVTVNRFEHLTQETEAFSRSSAVGRESERLWASRS